MKVFILAGGSGTRLWPLSRESYPKQFLKINKNTSLLQQTIHHFLNLVVPEDLIIITNQNYFFHVKSNLREMGLNIPHILLEPIGRNTAPAIALGIKYCQEVLSCSSKEVILVSPSDHVVSPEEKFLNYLKRGILVAEKGYVVTFGVKPLKPETGYGYIKLGEKKDGFYTVETFIEKPGIEKAKEFVSSGDYYWNAGIFAFQLDTILKEFQQYVPDIFQFFKQELEIMKKQFVKMPTISIDYAVMEKSKRLAVIPMKLSWNDVGCWDAVYDVLKKDKKRNTKIGDVVTIDTKSSFILGQRLIAAIGLKNILVIETPDAILIAKRGETQKVKEIVKKLKDTGRKEYIEPITVHRPWGSFTVLEEGERYKIKKIVVYPGGRLSLQMHYHRSEHWVVVRGTAKVRIGDKEMYVRENESVYIPKTTLHRLENPGRVNLEIIEVQNGEYIGEDDIVRFEDDYERI